MNYFVLNSIRKRHFESEVLPYIMDAYGTLATANNLHGADMKNALEWVEVYVDRTIHGKGQKSLGKLNVPILQNVDVETVVNTGIGITTFSGLAWNVPVALTSALMNSVQLYSNAVSNDFANDGLYGLKEAQDVVNKFFTSEGFRKKVEGLMEMYQVVERGEKDLVNHPRRKRGSKTVFTSHHAHYLNWVTDYYIRGMVMAAQMMKDGSWDAHSLDSTGKMKYDESKDKRWKGSEGKILQNASR